MHKLSCLSQIMIYILTQVAVEITCLVYICHYINRVHDDVIKWKIFRVTGPLCGEFTGFRWIPRTMPVTRSFDVFFDMHLIKRLSKHSRGWWFETLSLPLWRHCIATMMPKQGNHHVSQCQDPRHWVWNRSCQFRFDPLKESQCS